MESKPGRQGKWPRGGRKGKRGMECYRRRSGSREWERASLWERCALERYQEIQQDKRMRRAGPVLICTSRPDGSLFMAHLEEKASGVYLCMEDGQEEVMMIWAPTRP